MSYGMRKWASGYETLSTNQEKNKTTASGN